jgi:tripartite-type tricarboxylate transporter receptor subunit TctC
MKQEEEQLQRILPPVSRRSLASAAVAGLLAPAMASAQVYPSRPIRLIVPWPAGGISDASGRIIAQHLGERLSVQVFVDNRGGANGRIGAEVAAKAAPDGHTLLMASAETHSINPAIYRTLPYSPTRDFVAVAPFVLNPFALVARTDFPANTVREVMALARVSPGRFTYASWGIGSTSQIGMEMVSAPSGAQMVHVPFPGEAPGVVALMAGQVDLMVLPAARANIFRREGKVKVFAVTLQERHPLLPDVPGMREEGFPSVNVANWFGITAPAKTPPAYVERLAAEVNAIVQVPEIRAQFQSLGVDAHAPMTQQAFQDFLASDADRWADVVRRANISLD